MQPLPRTARSNMMCTRFATTRWCRIGRRSTTLWHVSSIAKRAGKSCHMAWASPMHGTCAGHGASLNWTIPGYVLLGTGEVVSRCCTFLYVFCLNQFGMLGSAESLTNQSFHPSLLSNWCCSSAIRVRALQFRCGRKWTTSKITSIWLGRIAWNVALIDTRELAPR